jgi:hypothetical protein
MRADNPATLDAIAEELSERAAQMRGRTPDAYRLPAEEAALQLTIALLTEMRTRRQAIPYPVEYYAHRVLHLVRWSGSNIGGGVMIEYLIHHGGAELELYFDRLLDQTGYTAGADLPEELRAAVQRMREEGRDPVAASDPAGSSLPTAEQLLLMDKLDSCGWPDIAASIMEMETRHPKLRDREMLIEELTTEFGQVLKKNGLPVLHGREWYREHIATLVHHYVHPLFASVVSCLLLNSIEQRSSRIPRRGGNIVFAVSGETQNAAPRYNS